MVLILLSLTLTFLAIAAKVNDYFAFDPIISRFVQNLNFRWFETCMRLISALGDNGLATLTIVTAALLLIKFQKRTEALVLFISVLGAKLISESIKFVVSRPRPDSSLVQKMVNAGNFDSFPSGHVLFFMGFYGFLLFLIFSKMRKGLRKMLLVFFLMLLIAASGLSRIYLGAHWFSDVAGGYIAGTIWLVLMAKLYFQLKR